MATLSPGVHGCYRNGVVVRAPTAPTWEVPVRIDSETRIAHPPRAVFEVFRDRLPEVVPYLDDIREIRVEQRDQTDGVVRLHNVWASDREVPRVVRPLLKPDQLQWDDFASWHEDGLYSEWEIRTRVFADAVQCKGRTEILDDGAGNTRVHISGSFDVDLGTVPGVPGFMGKRIAPQVEKFIVSLITPNLERTNVAVGRFLDGQG